MRRLQHALTQRPGLYLCAKGFTLENNWLPFGAKYQEKIRKPVHIQMQMRAAAESPQKQCIGMLVGDIAFCNNNINHDLIRGVNRDPANLEL